MDEQTPSPYYPPEEADVAATLFWDTPEYAHHKRTADWYWALGAGAIALVGIGIYLHDVLFAALVLLGVIGILMYALRAPAMMTVELNPRGIKTNSQLYPYVSIESFWITPRETNKKLIMQSKKRLMTWIVIPIPDDVDEHLVRDYLLDHVREEEHTEPLVDVVMDKLRF